MSDSIMVNVTNEGIKPVPPGPIPPTPENKNNTPWIILGSVLGGLFVIGVVVYLIYYIRKKRSEVGY